MLGKAAGAGRGAQAGSTAAPSKPPSGDQPPEQPSQGDLDEQQQQEEGEGGRPSGSQPTASVSAYSLEVDAGADGSPASQRAQRTAAAAAAHAQRSDDVAAAAARGGGISRAGWAGAEQPAGPSSTYEEGDGEEVQALMGQPTQGRAAAGVAAPLQASMEQLWRAASASVALQAERSAAQGARSSRLTSASLQVGACEPRDVVSSEWVARKGTGVGARHRYTHLCRCTHQF
jgi:hypothetical protein